jgi:ribonucleotide monophosphatase NagD (HAD superfamily)
MLESIVERHGLEPQQVAMVGDRLYTDMRMARDAGAVAVLTLTGETRESDVDQAPAHERPDIVVADLDELATLL